MKHSANNPTSKPADQPVASDSARSLASKSAGGPLTGRAKGLLAGMGMGLGWRAVVSLAAISLAAVLSMPQPAAAQQQSAQPSLRLPDDPASDNTPRHGGKYREHREHRVGGRLERITIIRENGFSETYRNNRGDTLWAAEEDEIGELPNMRQWIIGTW